MDRKKKRLLISSLTILLLSLLLGSCGKQGITEQPAPAKETISSSEIFESSAEILSDYSTDSNSSTASETEITPVQISSEDPERQESDPEQTDTTSEPANSGSAGTDVFDPENDISAYSGNASEPVHNGIPFFTDTEKSFLSDNPTTREILGDFDEYGRCGICLAVVGSEALPKGQRTSISEIKPTGWDSVRYDGIDGDYLYNRCHLIGWQLTGEDDPRNILTGTRFMNILGMEPLEHAVAQYVEETGNHVIYRATPVFSGTNLLAAGVLLEAFSLEDEGAGIQFCEFCYNVQPNVEIDYSTGASSGPVFAESTPETATESAAEAAAEAAAKSIKESASDQGSEPSAEKQVTYVGNANSKKFHYPNCSSVSDMKEKNKVFFYGDREEAIGKGYAPCKRCSP